MSSSPIKYRNTSRVGIRSAGRAGTRAPDGCRIDKTASTNRSQVARPVREPPRRVTTESTSGLIPTHPSQVSTTRSGVLRLNQDHLTRCGSTQPACGRRVARMCAMGASASRCRADRALDRDTRRNHRHEGESTIRSTEADRHVEALRRFVDEPVMSHDWIDANRIDFACDPAVIDRGSKWVASS